MRELSPVPVPTHFKFVFRGVFTGTEEIWSFGCKFSRDNTLQGDAGLTDIDQGAVDSALAGLLGTGFIAPNVMVSDWRAYQIGTNGKMEGNGPLIRTYAVDELKGAATANVHPPQIALVVSTIAENLGPAQRGRFYLPGPARALDSTMRLSLSDAGVYEDLATQFLKDVSNAIDLEDLESSVGLNVSPGPIGSSTGTKQTIDHVEVGRCLDTLRTRRNAMVEDYVSSGTIDW